MVYEIIRKMKCALNWYSYCEVLHAVLSGIYTFTLAPFYAADDVSDSLVHNG